MEDDVEEMDGLGVRWSGELQEPRSHLICNGDGIVSEVLQTDLRCLR